MKSDDFSDVDANLQSEVFEWFHQYQNMYVACDSWYKASMRNSLEYWECAGDLLLNWKDKGYRTVLDLLQVGFHSTEITNDVVTIALHFKLTFVIFISSTEQNSN